MRRNHTRQIAHTKQATEIRHSANVARSLQAMVPQTSAFVRLSSPPARIPGYVRLNPSSEWSKTALLCTALETTTLPTRLNQGNGRPGSLAELESTLNKTGSRTLFELQANVVDTDRFRQHPSGEKSFLGESQGSLSLPKITTAFDLDYSPRGSQATLGRRVRVFGQVEIERGTPREQIPVQSGRASDQDTIVEM